MSCTSSAWHTCFPFVDDFSALLDGTVTLSYLDEVERVLTPVVDLCEKQVRDRNVQPSIVLSLIYSVSVLARIKVAFAYREEIGSLAQYDVQSLERALDVEWQAMKERDGLVFVDYCDYVADVIAEHVQRVWAVAAVSRFLVARELLGDFALVLADVRVVVVGQVLVESSKGVLLSELTGCNLDKLLLPGQFYRVFLELMKSDDFVDETAQREGPDYVARFVKSERNVAGVILGVELTVKWLWALLSSSGRAQGYCYQLLFPPSARVCISRQFGVMPLVSEVLPVLEQVDAWSVQPAVVDVRGDGLHVCEPGGLDLELLRYHALKRIGMMTDNSVSNVPDYFARALVDDFISKHRRVHTEPDIVAPIDKAIGELTLDTGQVTRSIQQVAGVLYAGVGQLVSPRTEKSFRSLGAFSGGGAPVSELESQRVRALYERLADGAVIDESYFRHVRSRFRRGKHRPDLHATEGRSYHVFAAFPADGGGAQGAWTEDKDWDVPGWRSYVAVVRALDESTLSFNVDDGVEDARIDCTGNGGIDFGGCMISTSKTVFWFTKSVKFRLVAGEASVSLRLSVPDSGNAMAIGPELRRYMYIPGHALVARSFSIVGAKPAVSVEMFRSVDKVAAGCQVHVGTKYLESGRHVLKLVHLASVAPVRMLVSADPVDSLRYVAVNGMRSSPRVRDYVSFLFELRNSEVWVDVNRECTLRVAVVQVVRTDEFDLTVESIAKQRVN